ncbi:MAG: YdgA family protein [Gammaproteobacteria bacterium]|nr:YdgA family protein [Gammaproteobacteria bacterium]
MKKGIVALLVVVALIVLISPGLVGRLAEKSVDDNLNWAAQESGTLVVTSENFERGWFSSQGQHRVQLDDDRFKALLGSIDGAPEPGDLPVLVIDTRLDHGLIPLGSMSREKGSLAPGLGSAVSTLRIEFGDGEIVDLPGAVYSKVSIGGALSSSYVLPAGSMTEDGGTVSWADTNIDVTTNPSSGKVSFGGDLGTLTIEDGQDLVQIDGLTFSGHQQPTTFGFATGDIKMELGGMSVTTGGMQAGGLKYMKIDANTRVDGSKASGRTKLQIDSKPVPQFGEFSVSADVSVDGADAAALGALQQALRMQSANPDPEQLLGVVENDVKKLLASGLQLRFDRFDLTLPQGTVTSKLDFKIAEEDAATFEWTSLLLNTEASANVSVPQGLIDMAMQMNPQVGMAVGMGFLQQKGDVYEMEARYQKGLLTINGAPMPIPLGNFQ